MQPIPHIRTKSVGSTHSPGSSIPTDGIFDASPLSVILMTTVDSLVEVTGSLSPLEDFGITDEDIRQAELPPLTEAIQGIR
jgi:hypothetical protein